MANITINKLPHLNHCLTATFSPTFVAIKFFIENKNFHYLLHFHISQDILKLAIYCVIKGIQFIWKALTQSWSQDFTYSNTSKNQILEKNIKENFYLNKYILNSTEYLIP